ncbi:MAG: YraN family protein [Clostridiales bacterium]|nr:YraN family protein [Clostridiales bacterium]
MNKTTKKTGDLGEEIACRYLQDKGYTITVRNYRTDHGELDIIAENAEYIIFVEVKTRNFTNSQRYGRPADAVNRKKREHLLYSVWTYLHAYPSAKKQRMDIIEVYKKENADGSFKDVKINHIENAFGANGS